MFQNGILPYGQVLLDNFWVISLSTEEEILPKEMKENGP